PPAVRLDLAELRQRVARERLLDLAGEESVALPVEQPPAVPGEEPVTLVDEQDLEGVRIRGDTQPEKLGHIEDHALDLRREAPCGGGVRSKRLKDRRLDRRRDRAFVLLGRVKERQPLGERRSRDTTNVDVRAVACGPMRVAA